MNDYAALDAYLDDQLMHFGVKGMKWGQRHADPTGAPRKTSRQAAGDAREFARAKMFYGEGAGTRRKLIKAKVEAHSKRDPVYKKSFEHHLATQDLGKHAAKASGERKRKDIRAATGKTARGVNRIINGPFAPSVGIAVLGGLASTKQGQAFIANLLGSSPNDRRY